MDSGGFKSDVQMAQAACLSAKASLDGALRAFEGEDLGIVVASRLHDATRTLLEAMSYIERIHKRARV